MPSREREPQLQQTKNELQTVFWNLQVQRDRAASKDYVKPGLKVFPPEYTREELTAWLYEQEQKFQENLKKTLEF